MRVLITGSTGFVGAWSAGAIAGAGHDVRFLVRDPARLAPVAETLGVDVSDHVTGDITDPRSIRRALEGCGAVLHCAAVVATDPRDAEKVEATNLAGAEAVLGSAVEVGLDPIIHVSSITSLFRPGIDELTSELEPAGMGDAYGESKSAVERYARSLQADGAPVVITYPGMVVGPGVGNRFGEVAGGFETVLRGGIVPGSDAAWLVIDVRDLAAVHAAALEPDRGPRRYMVGGTYIDASQITDLFGRATGRRIIRLPVPGYGLRAMGSVVDFVARPTPWTPVLTRAAMDYYTRMPPSDDTAVHDDLGVTYRPLEETFGDCITSLAAHGRITPGQAGTAAPSGSGGT